MEAPLAALIMRGGREGGRSGGAEMGSCREGGECEQQRDGLERVEELGVVSESRSQAGVVPDVMMSWCL